MTPQSQYAAKRMTPDNAVARIASGAKLSMGMAVAEPPALLAALARRAQAGDIEDLRIYYLHSSRHAAETILRYELMDRIRPHCMFYTSVERDLIRQGKGDGRKVVFFVPNTFHQAPRLLTERIGVDTMLVTVSPMDRHGYFTLGCGNDYSSAAVAAARQVIVEVNAKMPRVFGRNAQIHVSAVDAIVENTVALLEFPMRAATATDRAISRQIAAMTPDGACLQMGVGAIPNLVCEDLQERNDLGVHTEALCPGLVDLAKAGVVNNRRKAIDHGKTVFTFAVGDRAMYDFLHDNPSVESCPVEYVNDPRVIAENDGVVSINATLQIDLTGACNSEHMMGHQFSGSGGQLDFVRGAYASRGGKSIIACHATARDGAVSRIVGRLDGPVTTPRIDTHIVVTEYGAVDLKGMSSDERALALIGLAAPPFREELLYEARQSNLL